MAYHGSEAIVLAVVLAVAALAIAAISRRIAQPIELKRPGLVICGLVLAFWLLSILMVLVAQLAYGIQLKEIALEFRQDKPQIGTVFYLVVSFFVILYLTRRHGWKVALWSGVFGALGAPMLFELPFDLIVMGRVFPPVPPEPWVYRLLYFVPLYLMELSTIALMALSPALRITRSAGYALAGMFAVWVVWAGAFGFAYPVTPGPLTVNVISKLLCFATAILLFAPHGPDTKTP